MNKKILIVSIMAVAILIGVSLTSVVGYQSIESNLKESPLFNVRSGRAIEKDSDEVTSKYIGKDNQNLISIPKRDNKIIQIQEWLEKIIDIDETTFNRYMESYIINQNKDNINRIINILQIIRCNSDKLKEFEENAPALFSTTLWGQCTIDDQWQLGCYVIMFVLNIITLIGIILLGFFYTLTPAMTICTHDADCSK